MRLSISKWRQGNFRKKLSAEKILSEMERDYSVLDNTDRRTCACACPALLKHVHFGKGNSLEAES